MAFTFKKTDIEGVVVCKPDVFKDDRGYFFPSYVQEEFEKEFPGINFVQDNQSYSTKGILRGLHFQKPPYAMAKLIRVIEGKIFDVAVDLRKNSETYGKWVGVELSDQNNLQLMVPEGCAHGFIVTSNKALVAYKQSAPYRPEAEGGINPMDPQINIPWPINAAFIMMNSRDQAYPNVADFDSPF